MRPQRLEGDSPWSATAVGTASAYNIDGDNLIEITNLAQLNAVRWEVDGNGVASTDNEANYAAAFTGAAANMGCPGTCAGYELTADLDFDSNGDGSVDAGDDYWNGSDGWAPISGYTAEFNGNGQGISNLFINRGGSYIGLFGTTNGAYIHHLGLIDVNVNNRENENPNRVASLVGQATGGTIAAVFATGSVTGGAVAAGLVADISGNIFASWTNVVVGANHDPDGAGQVAGLALGRPGPTRRPATPSGHCVTAPAITAPWVSPTRARR